MAGSPKEKDIYNAADMKKLWGYRKGIDGNIEITAYKGKMATAEVPPRIGKTPVTCICREDATKAVFPRGIRQVILPDGIKYIGDGAFLGAASTMEILDIPHSVTVIGYDAIPANIRPSDFNERYDDVSGVFYRKEGQQRQNGMIVIDDVVCGADFIDKEKDIWVIPAEYKIAPVTTTFPYLYYRDSERTVLDYERVRQGAIDSEIEFGFFPQDFEGNIKPIIWNILEADNGHVLALAKDILVPIPYGKGIKKTEWVDTKIREWLNTIFYEFAFTENEKKAIIPNSCNGVKDKVFILEYSDASKHFKSALTFGKEIENGAKIANTYSLARNIFVRPKINTSWWWLSTVAGQNDKNIVSVSPEGTIFSKGSMATSNYGVCPAIWIDTTLIK